MMRRVLVVLIAAAAVTMTGCKKEQPAPAEPTEVIVTEENLDAELERIEAEIEADIAADE